MTQPANPTALDQVYDRRVGPDQRRRLALATAATFPDDPATAKELIEMLGIAPSIDARGRKVW